MDAAKYVLGDNACGNCQRHRHTICRPRLDGTLCGCSCQTAEMSRNIYEDSCRIAEGSGLPVPTVSGALSHMYPVTCRKMKKTA